MPQYKPEWESDGWASGHRCFILKVAFFQKVRFFFHHTFWKKATFRPRQNINFINLGSIHDQNLPVATESKILMKKVYNHTILWRLILPLNSYSRVHYFHRFFLTFHKNIYFRFILEPVIWSCIPTTMSTQLKRMRKS